MPIRVDTESDRKEAGPRLDEAISKSDKLIINLVYLFYYYNNNYYYYYKLS